MERSDFHAAPFAVGFGSIMTAGLARHLAAASLDFGFGRRGDLVAHNRDDGCDIGEANDVGVDTRRTGGCFMERFWDDDIFLGMVLWPLKHARSTQGRKRERNSQLQRLLSRPLHDDKFHWIAGRDGAAAAGIGPDSIIVNGLVASAGEFEKTFKGDYFGVNADVSSSVGNDQWNGPVSSFQPSEFDVYDKMGRYVGWRMHYNDQAYDITTGEYTNRPMWKACELLEDDGDRACDAQREKAQRRRKRLAGLSDRLLDRQAKKRSTDWLTECGAALHDRAVALERVLLERVGAALEGVDEIALLDFPTHGNLGDTLIFQGELKLLEALHIDFPPKPRRAVLFHGGGNMGDLYAGYEHFRWAALEALPDYRLVVLPNTVIYDDANLSKLETYRRHGNLTLFARDAAFALRNGVKLVFDDLQPHEGPMDVEVFCATNGHCVLEAHQGAPHLLAAERSQRASNAVGAGDVVITDRLHGVIIATLLGRPAVALDTTNRKVSRFARTWLVPDGAADAAAACLVVADPDAPDADARALDAALGLARDRLSFDTSIW
ncbi:polysaccharide pyruvyl transferase [Aureococcus anophagefferens]|nr:polysaccharide pyruvyl transferase [Aureococcus anophagefferens]